MEAIDPAELARIRALPWLPRLDAGDAAQFVAEYEGALRETYCTGDRRPLELVMARWEKRSNAGEPTTSQFDVTENEKTPHSS